MNLCYLSAFFAGGVSIWERIATWYQDSLLRELLVYLNERYFTVEFGAYDHISLSGNAGTTVRNIVLALALGIIVASLMTVYTRNGLGGFVRRLNAAEANSPDKAKTLMELGYFRSPMIRHELSHGSSLRMVVKCLEKEKFEQAQVDTAQSGEKGRNARKEATFRIDFLTAHFYIPEDLRYRADIRFDQKGSGWISVLITVILTAVAAAAVCFFLPDLLQMADNLITSLSPS